MHPVEPVPRPAAGRRPARGRPLTAPQLELTHGDRRLVVPPGQPVTIGRDEAAGFQVVHPLVSRVHVELRPLPTGWELIDHSRNGVFVAGERLQQLRLSPGATPRLTLALGHGGPEVQVALRAVGADPGAPPVAMAAPLVPPAARPAGPDSRPAPPSRLPAPPPARPARRPVPRRRRCRRAEPPGASLRGAPAAVGCSVRSSAPPRAGAHRAHLDRRPASPAPPRNPRHPHPDRPRDRQRRRRQRPPGLAPPRRAALRRRRRLGADRPRQPQRHLRRRPAHPPCAAASRDARGHRARAVPPRRRRGRGARRARGRRRDRVPRRGPGGPHPEGPDAARPRRVRARGEEPARRRRPVRGREVDAAARAHRVPARRRGHRHLRRPRPLRRLRRAAPAHRPRAAGRHPAPAADRADARWRTPPGCASRRTPRRPSATTASTR